MTIIEAKCVLNGLSSEQPIEAHIQQIIVYKLITLFIKQMFKEIDAWFDSITFRGSGLNINYPLSTKPARVLPLAFSLVN